MEYYNYKDPDELYHHGVKGMKWGQRLYQRKDGSLTALGRSRHRKKIEAAKKKRQATIAAKEKRRRDVEAGKISSKKMTTEELEARLKRLNLEKQYNEALSSQKSATTTRGQKFLNKFLDSTVEKLADGVAADLVAQTVKAGLAKGINAAVSELAGSKQEVVYANNKKK